MKQMLTLIACAAIGMCLADAASAQGPVRRALRGAGEATTDAARITGQGIRAGVDSVTPGVPAQARLGGDVDRNASWRRVQHNGDWWYYTPENNWMVYRENEWAPYSAETFTPSSQYVDASASQQMVFIDSGGRAVICQNGQITFVDGSALHSVARSQVNAQGFLIEQGGAAASTGAAAGHIDVNQGAAVTTAPSAVQQSAAGQVRTDATGAAVGANVDAASPTGAAATTGTSASAPAAPSTASGSATQSTQGAASTSPSTSASGQAGTSGSVSGAAASDGANISGGATVSGGADTSGAATSSTTSGGNQQ